MISAVLQPSLFLAGHEGERLPASGVEGGGMRTLEHFSVCPDCLSSPAVLLVSINSGQIFPSAFSPSVASSLGIAGCPREATLPHPRWLQRLWQATTGCHLHLERREISGKKHVSGECLHGVSFCFGHLPHLPCSYANTLSRRGSWEGAQGLQGVVSNPFPLETSIPVTSSRDFAFQPQIFPHNKNSCLHFPLLPNLLPVAQHLLLNFCVTHQVLRSQVPPAAASFPARGKKPGETDALLLLFAGMPPFTPSALGESH